MIVVTAADAAYLPALKALKNSLDRHSPGVDLWCFTYGIAEEAAAMGVNVIDDPQIEAPLPTSEKGHWPTVSTAMYARLLIPDYFTGRVIWIDADSIVLRSVDKLFELDMEGHCVGAVKAPRPMLSQIDGLRADEKHIPAFYSGLMVIECEEWNEQMITERCFEVMRTRDDLDFLHVVQSVLCYVCAGKFRHINSKWQSFGNRSALPPDPWVVHYHGGNKPWLNHHPSCARNRRLWSRYAN